MAEPAGGCERPGYIDVGLLESLEARGIGTLKRFEKGQLLYCQGDSADCLIVVRTGKVKLYYTSPEGRSHTYQIVGAGRLVGDTSCLLGIGHESMAEAFEYAEVYTIPLGRLEELLVDEFFSAALIRELAQTVRSLLFQVRALGLMDVQQRLTYALARLAHDHGRVTEREQCFVLERGVEIDLRVTHEELAQLVAASRTTTTTCLNELRHRGYVWSAGRHLVIIPAEHIELLDDLKRSLIRGDNDGCMGYVTRAVEEGVDPIKIFDTLSSALRQVEEGYVVGELALPELLVAGFAMQGVLPVVEDAVRRAGKEIETLGTIVMGTVRGDTHDMGRSIVKAMLVATGLRVVDIGNDQAPAAFAEAAERENADIVGISAAMATTIPVQREVIEYFEAAGIRDKYRILVGGGACTREYAEAIGADAYGMDAAAAVQVARRLMGVGMEKEVDTKVAGCAWTAEPRERRLRAVRAVVAEYKRRGHGVLLA